ncbi:MAG: PatB family C-S lyase [Trueperaceae bacterium]|nr:PatB family C-S lyase [Trueperaceae bacterium]
MSQHPCHDIELSRLTARTGAKWKYFPADVLPLWVAEMDFRIAEPIKQAIRVRLDNDDLGYGMPNAVPGLQDAVADRLNRFGYRPPTDCVLPLQGTSIGLDYAARSFAGPGDEVLILTPLYPPFKRAITGAGRVPVEVELVDDGTGYRIDMDALEAAVTPATRMLMLCNPHNPVGRVFTRAELEALADFALRHNLWVISDDLHADLVFEGQMLTIAGISPEIAARTITLYGPSKAFNLPGLQISFAVASDKALLDRLKAGSQGTYHGPNVLAQEAALAAYTQSEDWLETVLAYLDGNRQFVTKFVAEKMPSVRHYAPEGTYLSWFDYRGTKFADMPAKTLMEASKVGLNEGADYGKGGAGFARLNFATTREILAQALDKLAAAL